MLRRSIIITGLSLSLLVLTACQPEGKNHEAKSHEPKEIERFVVEMQHSFDAMTKSEEIVSRENIRKMEELIHRGLYEMYPIYYDWWLQDGESIHWFQDGLSKQLAERLKNSVSPSQ